MKQELQEEFEDVQKIYKHIISIEGERNLELVLKEQGNIEMKLYQRHEVLEEDEDIFEKIKKDKEKEKMERTNRSIV